MQRQEWEYTTLVIDVSTWLGPRVDPQELDPTLNAYGAEGWELVSAFDVNRGHGATTGIAALFKRPR